MFSSRVRVYYAALRRIKQVHERNRAQGKIVTNRFGHSRSQEFDHVSRLVKTELERFEQERIVDFKKNLEQLLDGVMTRQKESIQAREALQ
ncbi:hypothetical protein EDB84DRAFT_1517870 [Lactarius hengduanensis]|nr:hypothetical protein EDB84DRAFT_1517870 [Lactarius hengduanensis]